MPYRHRKITYINLYILPLNYVESNWTPFLYFARSEGELLYCSDRHHFRRPKHPCNFAASYADARFHFDTFRTLGNDLLEQAQDAFVESRNVRLAAQFTAQAVVYLDVYKRQDDFGTLFNGAFRHFPCDRLLVECSENKALLAFQ